MELDSERLTVPTYPEPFWDKRVSSLEAMCASVSHDKPSAGYLGIKKTLLRVLQRYHWPEIFRDVNELSQSF